MTGLEQKKYFCPMCGSETEIESTSGHNKEVHYIRCTNEDCDAYGISWDLETINNTEVNLEQRTKELLSGD